MSVRRDEGGIGGELGGVVVERRLGEAVVERRLGEARWWEWDLKHVWQLPSPLFLLRRDGTRTVCRSLSLLPDASPRLGGIVSRGKGTFLAARE